MSTTTVKLNAKPREIIGKASHALVKEGLLPAVVYGAEVDALPITVERKEFERMMTHAAVGSTLVKLVVEGAAEPLNVIIKEVQRDPVKSVVRHIDFWAVRMGKSISTVVAITFIGSSEGERTGGVLLHELRELHIEALPKDLPEIIEIDVTPLNVGDALHVRDIVPPAGVTIMNDPDIIICAVSAPTAEVEEEAVGVIEGAVEVPEVGKDESGEEA
ncbi:MAG: 50S ribosomal protein L25 [Coriobacteriia bacterium]|nr:50S ribosomal protein L25 [Coriobacteriia bacterium]